MYDMATQDGPSIVYASRDSGEAVTFLDDAAASGEYWEATTDSYEQWSYPADDAYIDIQETPFADTTLMESGYADEWIDPQIEDPFLVEETVADYDWSTEFTGGDTDGMNFLSDFSWSKIDLGIDLGWDDVYETIAPWSTSIVETVTGDEIPSDIPSPGEFFDLEGVGGEVLGTGIIALIPVILVMEMLNRR